MRRAGTSKRVGERPVRVRNTPGSGLRNRVFLNPGGMSAPCRPACVRRNRRRRPPHPPVRRRDGVRPACGSSRPCGPAHAARLPLPAAAAAAAATRPPRAARATRWARPGTGTTARPLPSCGDTFIPLWIPAPVTPHTDFFIGADRPLETWPVFHPFGCRHLDSGPGLATSFATFAATVVSMDAAWV